MGRFLPAWMGVIISLFLLACIAQAQVTPGGHCMERCPQHEKKEYGNCYMECVESSRYTGDAGVWFYNRRGISSKTRQQYFTRPFKLCSDIMQNTTQVEDPVGLLYELVYSNCTENALQVLNANTSLSKINYYHNHTLLHLAIAWDNPVLMEALIDANPSLVASQQWMESPLILAAKVSSNRITDLLLSRYANVDDVDSRGNTTLHVAAVICNPTLAAKLIHKTTNVNARNIHKATPFHLAIYYECYQVAYLLLDHGADVHAKTDLGDTPLHFASHNGNWFLAAALYARGASWLEQNIFGETPLTVADRRDLDDFRNLMPDLLVNQLI